MGVFFGALFFILGPRNLTRYSGDPSENKTTRHGLRGPRIGDQFPRISGGSLGAVAELIDGGRCMRFCPGGIDIGSRCVSARARTADRGGFNWK